MINDTERREVARRLRGIDAERLDRVYGMDGEGGECSDPDMAKAGRNLMLGAIAEAVGLHYAPYYFDAAPLRDRLADLIEPSCDRDTPWKVAEEMFGEMRHSTKDEADAYEAMLKSKSVEIHPVDRDALLGLADEMRGELDECASDHEIAGNLQSQIDRIREALGVVE